jgi:hypothetical protein
MQKHLFASVCTLALLSVSTAAQAEHAHAKMPIGVMGAHVMPAGEWMASYRFDRTSQSDIRDGSSNVSFHDVLEQYGETPVDMRMNMHMLEGMVGVTPKLSLMAMAQYMEMDMVHEAHHSHHRHSMTEKGLGDTQISGVCQLMHTMGEDSMQSVLLNAGASLPTGSIDQDYISHHGDLRHMSYAMQFGSGTVDPILGATYAGQQGEWNWGAQLLGTFRVYNNSNDYHLGNRYTANLWAGKQLTDAVDASMRLEGVHWGDVSGADPMMPANSMAGATPALTGGEQVNAYFGLGLTPPIKALEGQRLALEFGAPVYQQFDGPLLETDYRLTLGWQIGF